jgi:hypothetical protein
MTTSIKQCVQASEFNTQNQPMQASEFNTQNQPMQASESTAQNQPQQPQQLEGATEQFQSFEQVADAPKQDVVSLDQMKTWFKQYLTGKCSKETIITAWARYPNKEVLYLAFSAELRKICEQQQDGDMRLIIRAASLLKKSLYKTFEHTSDPAFMATESNKVWNEILAETIKVLIRQVLEQSDLKAHTLRTKADLPSKIEGQSFKAKAQRLYSAGLTLTDNPVEWTLAFLRFADYVHESCRKRDKVFSLKTMKGFKEFVKSLKEFPQAQKHLKKFQDSLKAELSFAPWWPFGIAYKLCHADIISTAQNDCKKLQKAEASVKALEDKVNALVKKESKSRLKKAKKELASALKKVTKYQKRLVAEPKPGTNYLQAAMDNIRRKALEEVMEITPAEECRLTRSTILEFAIMDLTRKLKHGTDDSKVFAWIMASHLKKQLCLIESMLSRLEDYLGGAEMLEAMDKVNADGLITTKRLAKNVKLLSRKTAESMIAALPSVKVDMYDHQADLVHLTRDAILDNFRVNMINRSKTGYGKTAAMIWLTQLQQELRTKTSRDIRLCYISSLEKMRSYSAQLFRQLGIRWGQSIAGLNVWDWESTNAFGHNNKPEKEVNGGYRVGHKGGGRRGQQKMGTSRSTHTRAGGIAPTLPPQAYVADQLVDLTKLGTDKAEWIVVYDELSNITQTVAQTLPESFEEMKAYLEKSLQDENAVKMRMMRSEWECLERLAKNPQVRVVNSMCATMPDSVMNSTKELFEKHGVERFQDITSFGFVQSLELQLPNGHELEAERIGPVENCIRYIPQGRAVSHLLASEEKVLNMSSQPMDNSLLIGERALTPSLIYRALTLHGNIQVEKASQQEIASYDHSGLSVEGTVNALRAVKEVQVVQVLATDPQIEELKEFILKLLVKDEETVAGIFQAINSEIKDRDKELVRIDKDLKKHLNEVRCNISRDDKEKLVSEAEALKDTVCQRPFKTAHVLAKRSPLPCWDAEMCHRVITALVINDHGRRNQLDNLLAICGVHIHKSDKMSKHLIDHKLDVARLDGIDYWYGTDYAISSQITMSGPCPPGLDLQRLGRIGRGHSAKAVSVADLDTQLRRLNPQPSYSDALFTKMLSLDPWTFSLERQKKLELEEKQKVEEATKLRAAEAHAVHMEFVAAKKAAERQKEEQRLAEIAAGWVTVDKGAKSNKRSKKSKPKERPKERPKRRAQKPVYKKPQPKPVAPSVRMFIQDPHDVLPTGPRDKSQPRQQPRQQRKYPGKAKQIRCQACSRTFEFSAKQQYTFQKRGWQPPKRCQTCAKARNQRFKK